MIGDACPADIPDHSVDDHEFAVSTIIHPRQVVPAESVVPGNSSTGPDEGRKIVPPGVETAYCVEHYPHFDSGAGALRQRIHDARGDYALLQNVGFQTNMGFGLANRSELVFIEG